MNGISAAEGSTVAAGVGQAGLGQAGAGQASAVGTAGVGTAGVGTAGVEAVAVEAVAVEAVAVEAVAVETGAGRAGSEKRRITVFLLDDHEIVRRGLRDLLEAEPDMEVIGEAGTAVSAINRMPALRPDVAVLDVRLPDGDGVSVCREIRSTLPETACLMLTSYGDDQALLGAIMAGAAGYVLKQTCGSDLVNAVRTVADGGSMLDAQSTQRVMERLRERMAGVDPLSALTDQEKRVLELIGEGLTNRQIAERMVLSEKTAKNYVSAVLTKLGMQRRAQAAAFAARLAESHAD
jgi:DNA-binding NarL/FixJ family response regulator